MGGDPGGSQRRDEQSGSRVSRRRFVAGGLVAVGGTAQLIDGTTRAQFADSEASNGSVQIRMPTLDYQIIDQSENSNAEYQIAYQVEGVANFDRIEIQVENIDNQNIDGEIFTETSLEGVLDYPSNSNHDGGAMGQTYRFTFDVYESGNPTPVVTEQVDDEADGTGQGEGDFSNPNDPELDWVMVEDDAINSNGDYTVYYQVSNLANFGRVSATFEDTDKSTATATDTSTNTPNGVLTYGEGGTEDHDFDITIEVEKQNGLVVDSITISDTADGSDPSGVGDPRIPDSPTLESFSVTDNTDNSGGNLVVDYTVSNTARWAGVNVHFDNLDKDSADETISDTDAPFDSVSYSQGGTGGHTFHITVEVLETRNGITFPIDAGTVSDVASQGSGGANYPQDAI